MTIITNPTGVGRGALLRRNPNIVHRLLYDPCQLDFWVYIETLVPAFAILWFTLSVPLLDDILRDNAYRKLADRRGGSLRTLRHGQMGLRGGKEPKVNRWTDRGLRTLLRLTEPLEKLGFVILVFYAVDQFYYNWNSLLDNRLCGDRDRGSGFSAKNSNSGFFPNPQGGAVALPNSQQDWGGASVESFGGSVPNGHYFVAFSVNVSGDTPSTPQEYRARLFIPGNLGFAEFLGEPAIIGGGRSASLMVTADINAPLFGGTSIAWSVEGPAVPVGLTLTEAQVVCWQTS